MTKSLFCNLTREMAHAVKNGIYAAYEDVGYIKSMEKNLNITSFRQIEMKNRFIYFQQQKSDFVQESSIRSIGLSS